MKFLLFLAIVLLGVWLWRSSRGNEHADRAAPPPDAGGPQEMVRCAHCGVHLPHDDAVVGRIGRYCSPEHRQLAEP
ncbi:MAG: PP0621 family protein [Curvibacter sp.]